MPAIASKSLAAGAKSLREKESRGGLLNAKERKIHFMSDKIEFPWQELFRLRSDAIDHADQIKDLNTENKWLKEQINKMQCCANCRHAHYDGFDYECRADMYGTAGDCTSSDLELWRLKP